MLRRALLVSPGEVPAELGGDDATACRTLRLPPISRGYVLYLLDGTAATRDEHHRRRRHRRPSSWERTAQPWRRPRGSRWPLTRPDPLGCLWAAPDADQRRRLPGLPRHHEKRLLPAPVPASRRGSGAITGLPGRWRSPNSRSRFRLDRRTHRTRCSSIAGSRQRQIRRRDRVRRLPAAGAPCASQIESGVEAGTRLGSCLVNERLR
jgi:hypothetical protein